MPGTLQSNALTPMLPTRQETAALGRALGEDRIGKRRESEQPAPESEALARFSDWITRLWGCRDLQTGLETVLDAVIELMGADKGNIQLLTDTGMLKIHAQRGFEREFLEYFDEVSSSDESACSRALGCKEQIIEDVELDESFAPMRALADAAGFRAVVSASLISSDGTPQGVLSTHFRLPHRPTDLQLRRLALYVRHASDFVHRCKIEQTLRQNNEALCRADRRKDDFLAVLAHELRNTLAPICYALASNRKVDQAPEQRQWVDEVMERQVTHMRRLVDDLLDVSRITRSTLELKIGPTDLMSVLRAAIETARPLLDSKHHSLSLDFPLEAVWLKADAVRLAQVFSNLLINAAKYTDPDGKIELNASREMGQVVVSVRDNGIGIDPQTIPRLFTLFAQADTVHERTEGGLGVGLTLVREIVALHGGVVHAHSDGLGHGSQFIVTLPVDEPTITASHRDRVGETALQEVQTAALVDAPKPLCS